MLVGAILVAGGLLVAKVLLDRRGNGKSVGSFDEALFAQLSNAVDAHLSDTPTRGTVVDAYGKLAMAITEAGDALIVVRSQPSHGGLTLESNAVTPAEMVSAETREVRSSRTVKGGSSETIVGAVELHLFVNDLENPVVICNFLSGDAPAGSKAHLAARGRAVRWEALIKVLVFRGAREQAQRGQIAALQSVRTASKKESPPRFAT